MKYHRNRFGLLAIGLILLGLGCSRYIDSENPVRSLPTAAPTPINVAARVDNGSVTFTWEVSDTAAVSRFRLYIADSTGQNSRLRDSTTGVTFTMTVGGLQTNQRYFFTLASVGPQGIEGERSTPMSIISTVISISINNGAEFTNTRNVTVSLNTQLATTHVMLSENALMTGAGFEPFQSQKSFQLSDGDGPKRIYARFIYADGTQSGAPVSDSIKLDTRAEIDSVYFAPSGPFQPGDVVTFGMKCGETGGHAAVSFTGSATIPLADDGAAPDLAAGDGIYAGRYVVPTGLSAGNAVVTGSFTDAAGNQAPAMTSLQTVTVTSTPIPVLFTLVTPQSSSAIDVSWTAASYSDFSAYRLYRSQSRLITDTSKLIATIGDKNQTSVVDTSLLENTQYFYRLYAYNTSGLKAASAIDSARTLVNQPPTPVVLAATATDTVSINLTWSQNGDADFAYYRIYRSIDTLATLDTNDVLVTILSSQGTTSYTDSFHRNEAACAYRLYVFDKQGKAAGSNKAIVVK